jgi:hypothetical protein
MKKKHKKRKKDDLKLETELETLTAVGKGLLNIKLIV